MSDFYLCVKENTRPCPDCGTRSEHRKGRIYTLKSEERFYCDSCDAEHVGLLFEELPDASLCTGSYMHFAYPPSHFVPLDKLPEEEKRAATQELDALVRAETVHVTYDNGDTEVWYIG